MRQPFIIADMGADQLRITLCQRLQAVFKCRIPLSMNDQPAFPFNYKGYDVREEINSLLPGQATDHAEYRALGRGKTKGLEQGIFVEAPSRGRGSREIGENVRVRRRIPDVLIDAVDDAAQVLAPLGKHALHSHSHFRCEDFSCVSGAYRRHGRCGRQATLQKRHVAIIFEAIHGAEVGRQSEHARPLQWILSLKREIVKGKD
ncbi:hypothetical protein D3C80_1348320 [compost metagenome]